MKKIICTIWVTTCLFGVLACNNEENKAKMQKYDAINTVPEEAWDELSQKKIFFGHKSVGSNIIEGLKDVITSNPKIKLKIVETKTLDSLKPGTFAHFPIGKNGVPESKLQDFKDIIMSKPDGTIDMALMKFCWADFQADTNSHDIWNMYNNEINGLQKKYTKTKILHTTVPLTIVQKGIKAQIKKIIGRKPFGIEENVTRNTYNQLLRSSYDKRFVFDLADIESTTADGKKEQYTFNDKTYNTLVEDYTYDSGHLNEKGRKIAAENLLLLLVNS